MRLLAPDREADLYAIGCRLGLTKIGVAAEARERRRALQVGSPVPLELAGCYHYPRAQDAYAVAAELRRQLAERHEQGGWYRVTPDEVRQAIGTQSARQAPREAAAARRAALAAEAEAERQRGERARQRRRTRAQNRRQKLRTVARLLAAGLTQQAAGRELDVNERTIRRWTKLPGFESELAKARARQERERARQRAHQRRADTAGRRRARQHPARERERAKPAPSAEPGREEQPAAERKRPPAAARSPREGGRILSIVDGELGPSQDEQEAPLLLPRGDLHSGHEHAAARAVLAGGGMQAVIEASGLRSLENVLRLIDPAILARARQNDARAPAPES